MQKSYHTIGCAQKLGVSKSQLTKGMSLKEFDRPLCYKNNRTKNTPFYGGVLMNLNSYSWCSIKDDYRTLVGLESVNVVDMPTGVHEEEDSKRPTYEKS